MNNNGMQDLLIMAIAAVLTVVVGTVTGFVLVQYVGIPAIWGLLTGTFLGMTIWVIACKHTSAAKPRTEEQ
jgi:F0F1-type ATP synthase assembly protein I